MAEPEFNNKVPKDGFFFDPFGLHSQQDDASSTASPQPPPQVTRLTRPAQPVPREPTFTPDDVVEATRPYLHSDQTRSPTRTPPRSVPAPVPVPTPRSVPPSPGPSTPVAAPVIPVAPVTAIPPRLVVKFTAHEEVSSVAQAGAEHEGTSDVHIEGKLSAQVTSSDALKNVPFYVVATTPDNDMVQFTANDEYSTVSAKPLPEHALAMLHVPKTEITSVPIGTYSLREQVPHMPLLVERKVTMYEQTVRVALQVRSKLSNNGDLSDFTIAIAIPERVNAETIEVTRGEGVYDELKRTIKWSVPYLPKGESFMVSALAQLWSTVTNEDQMLLKFPVLLRCSSNFDQISNVELKAEEADGYPSSVLYSQNFSFRLLHRLP
ncbi:hypothetical protein MHU86_6221 [Fragilaria crotonensis]|nr:hypothetical protein MHU86_6221 [Fragilaria crotonensis]